MLTAELLVGEPSEVCERGAARSFLAGALSPQGPQSSGSGVTGLYQFTFLLTVQKGSFVSIPLQHKIPLFLDFLFQPEID